VIHRNFKKEKKMTQKVTEKQRQESDYLLLGQGGVFGLAILAAVLVAAIGDRRGISGHLIARSF
jgi:hypothetical protein